MIIIQRWGGGGGEVPLFLGGRVIIFSLLSGGGSQFFSRFYRRGFIEEINCEYPATAGAGFCFLLFLSLPSMKKCPEGRNKTIYMNLDIRYGIFKESQTDRRILPFYCYVSAFSSRAATRYICKIPQYI